MSSAYRLLGVSLVLLLFTVGNMPAAGKLFPGYLHWGAHITAYAVLALVFGLGWPRLSWIYIGLLVSVLGVLHELTEIIYHGHPFESADAMVNSVGAFGGALLILLSRRRRRT